MKIPHESAREFYSNNEATYLHRYTHSPSALRAIFHEPIAARYAKYDRACLETFNIPEYFVVRSKKHVPSDAPYVIQLTKRTYAYAYTRKAYEFIKRVVELYDALLATKTPKRRAQLQHAFPVSTLLKDLQKLRNAQSAEYSELKKVIPVTHLRVLAEMGVLRVLKVDWAWPKKTFVFMPALVGGWDKKSSEVV